MEVDGFTAQLFATAVEFRCIGNIDRQKSRKHFVSSGSDDEGYAADNTNSEVMA